MINSQKIKERAKECGVSQKQLADAIGIKQSSLNLKINNNRPMHLDEAEVIARQLQIDNAAFGDYFFAT